MRSELLSGAVIFLFAAGSALAQDQNAAGQADQTAPAAQTEVQGGQAPLIQNDTAGAENSTTMEAPAATDTAQTAPATTEQPATDTAQTAAPTTAPVTSAPATTDTAETAPDTTTAPAATDTAQTAPATTAPPAEDEGVETSTASSDGEAVEEVAPGYLLASELIDADVVQTDGTSVGEISDAIMDETGFTIKQVVVDVGGFLGMGESSKTVPVTALNGPDQDGNYQISMSKDEIEGLPDFVGRPAPEVPVDTGAGSMQPVAPAPATGG